MAGHLGHVEERIDCVHAPTVGEIAGRAGERAVEGGVFRIVNLGFQHSVAPVAEEIAGEDVEGGVGGGFGMGRREGKREAGEGGSAEKVAAAMRRNDGIFHERLTFSAWCVFRGAWCRVGEAKTAVSRVEGRR